MAPDEEDLYDEEFDFVDEEDEEADEEEVDEDFDEDAAVETDEEAGIEQEAGEEEGEVDEYGRPEPAANYVVHVYEYSKFKRTIDRAFTPEDAEAFATEFNRTGKSYGRVAVPGKNDAKPKKSID
jgi:hypothetical protein